MHRRELIWLLVVWVALTAVLVSLAKQNLAVPGLYYDEAVFGGLAKDFLTGAVHGRHMPNNEVATVFGRPFPVFVQPYLGALKTWMLLPVLRLFGTSVAVLRAATLCWALVALLLFMLATWQWLGVRTSLVAGLVLATDPTYFFLGVLDWGAAVPSFVCRCACFYLIVLWWRQQQARQLFFAAFFAGLGLFNKIDFAVLLMGLVVAASLCYRERLWTMLRARPHVAVLGCLGFILGAGPMLFKMPGLLMYGASGQASRGAGEIGEKLHTMISMYDGSYFYRLMNAGGAFNRMFDEPTNAYSFGGVLFVIAGAAWLLVTVGSANRNRARTPGFLLLAAALTTIGVFLLPGAVRIHHAVLVFPLPQLVIAGAAACLWDAGSRSNWTGSAIRTLALIAIGALLASQFAAILRTQTLIRETGGRGHWSNSLDAFCRENRHRTDLIFVSLDWGFNEQLAFLTNGPKLSEPVWALGRDIPADTPLPKDPRCFYLVHPPEYAVSPQSVRYLELALDNDENVEIQPYFDRQNGVAFFTIHFPPQ